MVYTGLRPGEKLHETLFHADERYRPTAHPKILQAEPRQVSAQSIDGFIVQMREASARYDVEALKAQLRAAVPEFEPVGSHDVQHEASTVVVAFPTRSVRKI